MERIQVAIEKAKRARQSQGTQAPAPQPSGRRMSEKPAPLILTQDEQIPDRSEFWKAVPPFNPNMAMLTRKRIVAHRTSPETAVYDVMRTKMMHQMRTNNWRRIAITSPGSGVGKSVTSLNLAFSLARQTDLRIMLIEMDMRRPSLAKVIGLKEHNQFSDVLADKAKPSDHMIRYGKNLIMATNHAPARNPAELLQGVQAATVLDRIEADFAPDFMLFDMPPIFANDDTIAFLDQVDCALLIGEAERTTLDEIDKCEQELAARTNVLGVVLNKCRYLGKHEGYGKEYGY